MVTCGFPFSRRRLRERSFGIVGSGEYIENELTPQLTEEDITWAIQHTKTNLSHANEKGNRSFTIKPYHSEIDLVGDDEEDEEDDEEEDLEEAESEDDEESVTAVGSPEASRRLQDAKDAESDCESEGGLGKEESSGGQLYMPSDLKKDLSGEGFKLSNTPEGRTEQAEGQTKPLRTRGRPAQRYMEYVRDRSNVKSIFRPSSQYLRSFKLSNKPNPPPRRFHDSVGESIDSYI